MKIGIFMKTRLLGRFAPIFYLNCEHVLFVYILKQRRKKFRGFFKKNLRIFKILKFFTKIKTFKHNFLKFLSFVNLGRKDVNLGRKDVNLGRKDVNLGRKDVNLGRKDVNLGRKEVNLGGRM